MNNAVGMNLPHLLKKERHGFLKSLKQLFKRILISNSKPEFFRNGYDHYVLTVTGTGLSGESECICLGAEDIKVDDQAKGILTHPNYNRHHSLKPGKEYRVVVVPVWEIKKEWPITIEDAIQYGKQLGYKRPPAGIVPYVSMAVSGDKLGELGICRIVGLHSPIKNSYDNDSPDVLLITLRPDDPPELNAYRGDIQSWLDECDMAVLFLAPLQGSVL